MKNWSPEHTKEIKAWLDIDNYRKLEDISLNALYHELWARALLYKGNDSNLLIVFYVQIMPDDFVMQLHRF
ncbi:hypothetical protein BvCmsSINP014_03519 [Escherichia coli]|nr:hypothetical protein BvCmsSINP014_03519 [Escherichia coli]